MKKLQLIELYNLINNVYNVDIKKHSREAHFITYKRLFCYIAYKHLFYNFSEIARFLNLNHATCMHHVYKFSDMMSFGVKYGYDIDLEEYKMLISNIRKYRKIHISKKIEKFLNDEKTA